MAIFDVRNPFRVDELKFSDNKSIVDSDPTISIRTAGVGQDRTICAKSEVDDLIKALQASKKVW